MRWLFHAIVRGTPVEDPYAPASLPREGFVHASFRDELAASVRAHFPPAAPIDVLQIDPRRVAARIAIEPTPRGLMPHVCGAIPRDAIARQMSLEQFEHDLHTLPDRTTGTRAAFVAFEGMTFLDLVGVYDPLSRIASMGFDPAASCEIVGAHRGRIWAQNGAELTVDRVRPPLDDFDLVVVPGGPGTRVLEHDPSLADWVASFPHNRLLASVCTGALLLGVAGRLKGRRATTHHLSLGRLADYGAVPAEDRVVEDGPILTAGGVTSGIDLGLYLVRRLEGDDVAAKIAAQMEWTARI